MPDKSTPETVETIIRDRKTEKVLCDIESHQPVPADIAERNRKIVLQAIQAAGWAPFHYPRKVNNLAEPWRAHVLWDAQAKQAAIYMRDELNVTSKEPRLAAACSALVLVTWLPEVSAAEVQQDSKVERETLLARDEEHLAAASSMVQNLLLMLTAHGMGNYWSGGGKLKGPEMFQYLGIPEQEKLLAAVFIEYPEMRDDSRERKPGSLRNDRSDQWIREVTL